MRPLPTPPAPGERGRRKLAGGVFIAFGVLALLAWIGIIVASIRKTPGIEGVLGGIFGGLFIALLVAVAGAWLAMRVAFPPSPKVIDPAEGVDLEASLRDVLDELEKSRLETIGQINQRAAWRVPLCVAGGLGVWIMGQFTDDPGDLFDLAAMLIVPGLMGYVWASLDLSNKYGRLYKSHVLPRLAASFGDLSYRHAVAPDMARLKAENLFREDADASADDEIFGTYRGLPLNIVELKLERGSGKDRSTVFDGLLVEIELHRDTHAVTAVVSDEGAFGNFRDRMKANGRQRVRLEDPVFEKVYEVYGDDQIAARALLNPAFMERLLALGERPDFGRPLALCSGRRLTFAMPKRLGRNLFEPPSFQKPAASREALVQLRNDIAAVLSAADAVIDLDHRFEVRARQ
jgi:hypothetical protein